VNIISNTQCRSDEQNPLQDYLSSLDKVNDIEIDLVLPGHRRRITDHRTRIAELKEHHERRLKEVLSILGDDPRTAFQVASRMTWDLDCDSWEEFPRAQKWFATGEAIAHVRYLERKRFIVRKDEERMTAFTLNDLPLPGAKVG